MEMLLESYVVIAVDLVLTQSTALIVTVKDKAIVLEKIIHFLETDFVKTS